jgi:nitroreductase
MLVAVADNTADDRLHPLLRTRWSPLAFDPEHTVSRADAELLLEAARWSPSAGNSQPWAFIVGRRGDEAHRRLVPHLARSSSRWAPSAGLLVANLAHRFVEDTDWEYSEFAQYDLGQAVAHMTIQAQALGLATRQFRAFDRDGLAGEFAVPEHWEVTTMTAIGRAASTGTTLPAATDPSRRRRPVHDLLWPAPTS